LTWHGPAACPRSGATTRAPAFRGAARAPIRNTKRRSYPAPEWRPPGTLRTIRVQVESTSSIWLERVRAISRDAVAAPVLAGNQLFLRGDPPARWSWERPRAVVYGSPFLLVLSHRRLLTLLLVGFLISSW